MKLSLRIFGLLLVGLAFCSCQSPIDLTQEPAIDSPLRDSSINSAEFAYNMASQTWCTNDQACTMILLMLQQEDRYQNFQQRLAALQAKGLADPSWKLDGEANVTKGTLAYMVCRGLDIKGGLLMQLLDNRRYAYREALHRDLMERGSENEPLTGPEVVGIMGRAARFESQ